MALTDDDKQFIRDEIAKALSDLPVVRLVSGPKTGTVHEESKCQGGCGCDSGCGCG